LDLAYLECLSVIVATQFATNEQLKDLTHMFFFLNPMLQIIYLKKTLLCSHIKIHVPFWDELKKLKGKT
jgi:hypothetical protein